MLELENIRKIYKTGDTSLAALDGVSLCFRENEFVSILGPSGCGKTTMLNIIGGLDRYTDGNLFINGRSTKSFKDRDWDTYRNHSIGFVFQSYNLIPHQTVLANVELALTLSGVSKSERKAKATEALKKVGLGEHLHKKPNQMSGGQMQRVAIARALVNNPDILLADEPTGALDTQTSVQIMDLLKEIAEDRLVIMVTHNPELAEEYSTRIVSLSDGKVVNDTNPITGEEYEKLATKDRAALNELKKTKKDLKTLYKQQNGKSMSFRKMSSSATFCRVTLSKEEYEKLSRKDRKTIVKAQKKKKELFKSQLSANNSKDFNKKKSMSFGTAISLSFKNLLTKKGRTILTSFAGSIGIIGIALILSLSNGITLFIEQVQEDTLSTYPLTIQKVTSDSSAMMDLMLESEAQNVEKRDPNLIYVDDRLDKMFEAMMSTTTNDLVSFKKYIDKNYESELKEHVTDIQYTYNLDLQVYNTVTVTKGTEGSETDPLKTTTEHRKLGTDAIFDNMTAFQSLSELVDGSNMFNVMSQMISKQDLLEQQYELVGEQSKWPTEYNEVVLVVGSDNSLSTMALFMLGLLDAKNLQNVDLTNPDTYQFSDRPYSIDELLGMELTLINKPDVYQKTDRTYSVAGSNTKYPIWEERADYVMGDVGSLLAEKGIKLKITGIIRPRVDSTAASIASPIGYTKALTDKLLEDNTTKEIVKQQHDTPTYNVLTGLEFTKTEYTPENIHELLEKISDSKKQQFYSTMKQMVLNNPEFTKDLEINSTTFSTMFFIMPKDVQVKVITDILSSESIKNTPEMMLTALFTAVSQASNKNITVTKDNFVACLPSLDTQQIFVALSGVTKEMGSPIDIPGLAAMAGEQTMNTIYAEMSAAIPTIEVTDEVFTLIVGNMSADDERFKMLEDSLYKMATNADATFDSVILELGAAEEESPATINFYAKNFESKGKIEDFIAKYNEPAMKEMATEEEKAKKIEYTDLVGSLMSSVTIIIDVISYVLIAFVSISLIVSSIMIGIITNISVLERTKEIGILRAIGASKKDVSRVFNAETFIVGLIAGLLGILITLILCWPANTLIAVLSGFSNIRAVLPVSGAIVLVLISMGLTMLAGLIPSKKASKKDPVVALRTE